MYGKFGSIRYICSSFSVEIKQSDLFECSLFLGKCVGLFSSTYCLDSLFRMSEVDPGLCPIRAIFSKTVFPSRLDPTGFRDPRTIQDQGLVLFRPGREMNSIDRSIDPGLQDKPIRSSKITINVSKLRHVSNWHSNRCYQTPF